MSFPKYKNSLSTNDNWGYPVYLCNCCPYGYHIDLDFVQYCETISKESDRTGSIKRRKDRRRQRKSMEVLLGLDTIEQHYAKPPDPISPIIECENRQLQKQDSFDNVIDDFEKTFQRSKNKLSNNLPDVTAVSDIRRTQYKIFPEPKSQPDGHLVINEKVPLNQEYDNNSCHSCPKTFMNIREQMALSLQRTRQLEEQMKQLPELKAQISTLKDENTRLKQNLKQQKAKDTKSYLDAILNQKNRIVSEDVRSTRDIGTVTSKILTENTGVGTETPIEYARFEDKWYGEKLKFINDQQENDIPLKCTKGNQTELINKNTKSAQTELVNKNSQSVQTIDFQQKKLFNDKAIQTFTSSKHQHVLAKPQTNDFNVQKSVEVYSVGVSDDTITDINCEKCNTVAQHVSPISLASLSFPRSKSFNLGEGFKRSVAVQYQYKPEYSTKSSQYEPSTMSKSSQSNIIQTHSKGCQPESIKLVDSFTQSEISKTDETIEQKQATVESTICVKCRNEDDEKIREKTNNVSGVSKIPRLTLTPTLERRKFRRQDTYTKINASPPPEEEPERLSGLDLSKPTFEKVRENPPAEVQAILTTPYIPTVTKQRKKSIPSKEMQGAMKVLNDSLHKQTKLTKNHRAIDIIQQEWFKISGLVTANPLDVEDYLDAFEDMSSLLLDYIVNMTDASGNTAMHYAVSHGNFDVVSILLDSKVCDINKPNKAGYTSVMLVSLADIRSQTHANVVRRLFQMADVNIRAKQHGQTALMLAVSHGRLDMVKMLLEAGADINIQDDDGSTALMCAAEHGHIEIVKHFLSHPDCDSTITDVDGSTALKIAMEAEHRPIGVLLYAHERNLTHKHKKKPSMRRASSEK